MASITANSTPSNNNVVEELRNLLTELKDNTEVDRRVVEHLEVITEFEIEPGEGHR